MSTTLICSGCRVRLIIRDSVRTPFITCPRCLVAVPNPRAGAAVQARSATAGHVAVCTVCAEPLPEHAGNCPVARPRPVQQDWNVRPADADAGGDSGITFMLAVALAAMITCGLGSAFGVQVAMFVGVILFLAIAFGGQKRALRNVGWTLFAMVVSALGLALLAFVAFLIMCGGGGRGR